MESLDENFQAAGDLHCSTQMLHDWQITARWANFLSIAGFVLTGFSLLSIGSIPVMFEMFSAMGIESPYLDALLPYVRLLTVGILIALGLQFMLYLYQFRFASLIRKSIQFNDAEMFENAWLQFRNLFRLAGILTIFLILVYLTTSVYIFNFVASRNMLY
ncbi:MAG: hypothetical protein EP344_08890 [Bacteroidetes bacterium]|nr:MAG: hypothetical protein EP344_08890 [Bacteroidota bacterium]